MNRMLVTGLALGTEAGVCQACNFDYTWLINYPSILVWADKIMITKNIWDSVIDEKWPEPRGLAKCFKMIFEIAKSEGIIEIIDPSLVFTDKTREKIYVQIEEDLKLFKKHFPQKISTQKLGEKENSPTEIIIDGIGYCEPSIWSIYGGLILAKALKANCLFDNWVMHYCRYKFGIKNFPIEGDIGKIESFKKVFDSSIPNTSLIPFYAIEKSGKCALCKYEIKCEDTYLGSLESELRKILEWRNYDEINQLKNLVEKIIKEQYKTKDLIDPNDVITNFNDKKKKIRKNIYNVFPKVKRWANIATMISIPISAVGIATGNAIITVAGVSIAGFSGLTKEQIKLLENKYRWITFLPSLAENKKS